MHRAENVVQAVANNKHVLDGALASGGVSAPFWLQYVDKYSGTVLFVGGVALLILRILISIEELRKRKRENHDDRTRNSK